MKSYYDECAQRRNDALVDALRQVEEDNRKRRMYKLFSGKIFDFCTDTTSLLSQRCHHPKC